MPAYHWSRTALTLPSHGIAIGAPAEITTTVFGLAAAAWSILASWSIPGGFTQTGKGHRPGCSPRSALSDPSDSLSPTNTIAMSDPEATAAAAAWLQAPAQRTRSARAAAR